jgi:hypothetical protein
MSVMVDKARTDDHSLCVDHSFRVFMRKPWADRYNAISRNRHIGSKTGPTGPVDYRSSAQ